MQSFQMFRQTGSSGARNGTSLIWTFVGFGLGVGADVSAEGVLLTEGLGTAGTGVGTLVRLHVTRQFGGRREWLVAHFTGKGLAHMLY